MQNTALVLKKKHAYDEINLILVYLMTLSVSWMMRWLMHNERCARKPMWSNVSYYLYFFLEEMTKIMEDLEITDLWADFWTWMPLRYEVTVPCTCLQNNMCLCPSVACSQYLLNWIWISWHCRPVHVPSFNILQHKINVQWCHVCAFQLHFRICH
jgi:hypothetical protein